MSSLFAMLQLISKPGNTKTRLVMNTNTDKKPPVDHRNTDRLENRKLTKKQLAFRSYMFHENGSPLSIGELNMDQLRYLLYEALQMQVDIEKKLIKAKGLIHDCLP